MSAHGRTRMQIPTTIRQAVSTHSQALVTQSTRAVSAAVSADHGATTAAAGEWFAASKSKSVRQIVRRSRALPSVASGLDLIEQLTPLTVRPPAMDPFQVWVFAHALDCPPEEQFYAWTTNRMMDSVHWWLEANEQVVDQSGKIFITFDGDHDVISGKASKRQTRLRKFGECEETSHVPVRDDTPGLDAGAPHVQQPKRRRLLAHPSNHMECTRRAAALDEEVDQASWVHIFACTERAKQERRLGYVHSATPFCGIVARSENSHVLATSVDLILKMISQEFKYSSIDIEGARADNGSAARAAVEKFCPDGFKAGCFTHEIFKAQQRHQSWTLQFAPLEQVWDSNPKLRASGLHLHEDTFAKEYNFWMHLAYRCPGGALFQELGNVPSYCYQVI